MVLLDIKVISLFIVTTNRCNSKIITFKKRKSFEDLVTETINKILQEQFAAETIKKDAFLMLCFISNEIVQKPQNSNKSMIKKIKQTKCFPLIRQHFCARD